MNAAEKLAKDIIANYNNPLQSSTIDLPAHVESSMTYYHELSIGEASSALGIPAGTYKARMFRARRHLKDQAQRFLVVPIRGATHCPFSFDKVDCQVLAVRPAEISSPEIALS